MVTDDDPQVRLQDGFARARRWHEAAAWYRPLDAEGFSRFTVKGACFTAWRELWPTRPLRRMMSKRRSERLIEELGV